MATGSTDPNCSINRHYKDGWIRATIDIPGLKTTFVGLEIKGRKFKVDPTSADYNVNFEGNQAVVDVTMKKGTMAGTRYHKELTQDDLNCLVAPDSYHKVEDGKIVLFIRKR